VVEIESGGGASEEGVERRGRRISVISYRISGIEEKRKEKLTQRTRRFAEKKEEEEEEGNG